MDPIPLYYKSYEAPELGIVRPFEGIEMKLVEGETEIMPGVRVFETPGHSVGHQSVEIDTAEGSYICCGDAIFIMDNVKPIEKLHYDITPPNRFSDIVATWKSIRIIKERAESLDKILTCHDREIMDRVKRHRSWVSRRKAGEDGGTCPRGYGSNSSDRMLRYEIP